MLLDPNGWSSEKTAESNEEKQMRATSVKVLGYSCFQKSGAGFDAFAPITVVIGRNNTGKSRLLDFADVLTAESLSKTKLGLQCTATLDEEFLKVPFSRTTSGGELGPIYGPFSDQHSHWNATGKHYLGAGVEWKCDPSGKTCDLVCPKPEKVAPQYRKAAEAAILDHLRSVRCPLSNLSFRRMLADRDVVPETSTTALALGPDGKGATNIIRRFITSSSLPEDLVQVELLRGLNFIFGSDGEFQRIEIREHDGNKNSTEALWEVFLGESGKGQISLSQSGSGLKTVLLALLNLRFFREMPARR